MSASSTRVLLLGTEPSDGTAVNGVRSGTSVAFFARNNSGILTFYFTSIAATTGGTIVVEEADWDDKIAPYSGTWSQVAAISANSFTGGAQYAYHLTDAAYSYLRVRISDAITGGGSITAVLVARSSF